MQFSTNLGNHSMRLRKPVKVIVLTLAVLLAVISSSQPALAAPDNQGDEFVVGFMDNLLTGETILFLTGPTATVATVSAPGVGFGPTPFAIVPGTITTVTLPLAIRATGSGTIQAKGVLISAPDEFTVYGLNQAPATTDAFLGLPVDIQGTDYVVPSFTNRPVPPAGIVGEFMVVGIEDTTTVTIKPTAATVGGADVPAIAAGASFVVVIDRLDVLQIQAVDGAFDLTGSEITSDKPISVFSGHLCADVPVTEFACDHLVEQIPPTSTWGTSFLTAPLATRTGGDLFRITSAVDSNDVMLDGALVATIDRGEFHEMDLASGTYHEIDTSKAAILTQYSKGTTTDGITSDPMMMMIPPTGQFANDYTISTLAAAPVAFINFVNIVAPTADLAGLLFDGGAIGTTWTPIGGSGFSGTQVPVAIGAHTITHASPIVPFGVYSYGFAFADSYGYPGGLRLAPLGDACIPSATVPGDGLDNDCDGLIDEELLNGIDDDGDGLIDEDLAAAVLPPCSDEVAFTAVAGSFVFSGTSVVGGPAGTYAFDALLTNTGSHDLEAIFETVTILTNANTLIEADGGPGGVGSIYTTPLGGDYADGTLSPGESVVVPQTIGLAVRSQFDFFVEVDCSVLALAP